VRVSSAEAELARIRFLEVVPEGFEEVDGDDWMELAAYTDERGEERIRAIFGSVEIAPVEPGWEDRWRSFHHSVQAGGLWIGPPWEKPPAGRLAVVVEPGQAFGTGAHPTTRACVELLSRARRGSVVDAGCGSGVLAIAAAKLGFRPVTALDLDDAAVEATRQNVLRNDVDVDVRRSDCLRDDLPSAEILVANIELAAVEQLLGRWRGDEAIVSGFLTHESPTARDWAREERLELEGWAAERFARME
jgi:ribosomal protein L11 methyltransferase